MTPATAKPGPTSAKVELEQVLLVDRREAGTSGGEQCAHLGVAVLIID